MLLVSIGSGPIGFLSAAIFASSSAFSFPKILECPGAQIMSTLFVMARLLRFSQHSRVKTKSNTTEDSAFNAA